MESIYDGEQKNIENGRSSQSLLNFQEILTPDNSSRNEEEVITKEKLSQPSKSFCMLPRDDTLLQNIERKSNNENSLISSIISSNNEAKKPYHVTGVMEFFKLSDLLQNNPTVMNDEPLCNICMADPEKEIEGLECGHKFCFSCFRGYLENLIKISKVSSFLVILGLNKSF